MKKLLFIFVLLTGAANSVWGQSEEYKKEFGTMMELSGNAASFEQVVPQILNTLRQQLPNVPAEFWMEAEKEMGEGNSTLLIDMLAPIYHKHLTLEDLKQINLFYATEAGKKWGLAQPAISQEQLTASMKWGQEIGEKIIEKLRIKGYFK